MTGTLKGLFVNNKRAQDSIYESGVMVFESLKLSKTITFDYAEISVDDRTISQGYDFYFFNYHPNTMSWLDTSTLKRLDGMVITMVLEVLPGDPFVMCPRNHFHFYCVLDPSLKSRWKNVVPFPRPLEKVDIKPYVEMSVPVIGSFGFATRGKGFQHVVDAVNKEFENAIVKINIPFGSFVPDSESYSKYLADICRKRAKPGIEVIVSHDYMTKHELIEWCAKNTLNCFLYDRDMPGLAATTDQAIVASRPLAVSRNETFRHILAYLPPYPVWSLKRAIQDSGAIVETMKSDWSPENFARKFETLMNKNLSSPHAGTKSHQTFTLRVKKIGPLRKIFDRVSRFRRKLSVAHLVKWFTKSVHDKELI